MWLADSCVNKQMNRCTWWMASEFIRMKKYAPGFMNILKKQQWDEIQPGKRIYCLICNTSWGQYLTGWQSRAFLMITPQRSCKVLHFALYSILNDFVNRLPNMDNKRDSKDLQVWDTLWQIDSMLTIMYTFCTVLDVANTFYTVSKIICWFWSCIWVIPRFLYLVF